MPFKGLSNCLRISVSSGEKEMSTSIFTKMLAGPKDFQIKNSSSRFGVEIINFRDGVTFFNFYNSAKQIKVLEHIVFLCFQPFL